MFVLLSYGVARIWIEVRDAVVEPVGDRLRNVGGPGDRIAERVGEAELQGVGAGHVRGVDEDGVQVRHVHRAERRRRRACAGMPTIDEPGNDSALFEDGDQVAGWREALGGVVVVLAAVRPAALEQPAVSSSGTSSWPASFCSRGNRQKDADSDPAPGRMSFHGRRC